MLVPVLIIEPCDAPVRACVWLEAAFEEFMENATGDEECVRFAVDPFVRLMADGATFGMVSVALLVTVSVPGWTKTGKYPEEETELG